MKTFSAMVLAVLACPASTASASLMTIDSWSLSAGVVADFPNVSVVRFTNVMSPFVDSHATSVFDSTASSSYSIEFDESAGTGNFLIEGQHTAQGIGSGILQSRSSGGITIDVATDLLFTVHGSYNHSLPLDVSVASFGVNILTPGGGVPPLLSVGDSQSAWPGPPNGTLTMDAQVIIPGGQSWLLQYGMGLTTINAPPGGLSEGDGFIQFSFAPVNVPEPATASLLLAAAPILLRRGRH